MINAQWLGDYTIPGYALYDLGHYPEVVSGNGAVYGEVYRIESTTLAENWMRCAPKAANTSGS